MKRSRTLASVAALTFLFAGFTLPAAALPEPAATSERSEPAAEQPVREVRRPQAVDRDGTEHDVVVVPSVEGVQYVLRTPVADVPAPAGRHAVGRLAGPDARPYVAQIAAVAEPGTASLTGDVVFELIFTQGLVAGQPAVAVVDNNGLEPDHLVLSPARGIRYLVDGVQWPAGTHTIPEGDYLDGRAGYRITIELEEGFDIPGGGTAGSWWAAFERAEPLPDAGEPIDTADPGEADERVEPPDPDERDDPTEPEEADLPPDEHGVAVVDLPVIARTLIDGVPGYLLPHDDAGFTWFVDGSPVSELVDAGSARLVATRGGDRVDGEDADGASARWYEITGVALGVNIDDVVIAAAASPGFVLVRAGGEAAAVHYVVDPRTPVELELPTPTDGPGEQDFVSVHEVEGQMVHDVDGNVLDPGEHPVTAEYVDGTATVDLTVQAVPGYRLEQDGTVLDSTPGRSAEYPVQLVFTDEQAVAEENDNNTDGPDRASSPAEDAEQPDENLGSDDDAPSVVVPATVTIGHYPPPQDESETEPAPESPADESTERLSDSGLPGVETTVLLGVLFLGAAGLVLGFGRDAA